MAVKAEVAIYAPKGVPRTDALQRSAPPGEVFGHWQHGRVRRVQDVTFVLGLAFRQFVGHAHSLAGTAEQQRVAAEQGQRAVGPLLHQAVSKAQHDASPAVITARRHGEKHRRKHYENEYMPQSHGLCHQDGQQRAATGVQRYKKHGTRQKPRAQIATAGQAPSNTERNRKEDTGTAPSILDFKVIKHGLITVLRRKARVSKVFRYPWPFAQTAIIEHL